MEASKEETTAGTVVETKTDDRVNPHSLSEALKINEDFAVVVAEVLGLLGSYGVTFSQAIYILEEAKRSAKETTLLQTKYTP